MRCLFTGDTLFLPRGEWSAAVLATSDRESYIRSLELIRELDFDPRTRDRERGAAYYAVVDRDEAQRRIDGILASVRDAANP